MLFPKDMRSLFSAALLSLLAILAAIDFRPALGLLYVAGEAYATAMSDRYHARGQSDTQQAVEHADSLLSALGDDRLAGVALWIARGVLADLIDDLRERLALDNLVRDLLLLRLRDCWHGQVAWPDSEQFATPDRVTP